MQGFSLLRTRQLATSCALALPPLWRLRPRARQLTHPARVGRSGVQGRCGSRRLWPKSALASLGALAALWAAALLDAVEGIGAVEVKPVERGGWQGR
ncbi:MAG: hypothetical protein ACPGUV_04270, partial [Polyangiales bacterium]